MRYSKNTVTTVGPRSVPYAQNTGPVFCPSGSPLFDILLSEVDSPQDLRYLPLVHPSSSLGDLVCLPPKDDSVPRDPEVPNTRFLVLNGPVLFVLVSPGYGVGTTPDRFESGGLNIDKT